MKIFVPWHLDDSLHSALLSTRDLQRVVLGVTDTRFYSLTLNTLTIS